MPSRLVTLYRPLKYSFIMPSRLTALMHYVEYFAGLYRVTNARAFSFYSLNIHSLKCQVNVYLLLLFYEIYIKTLQKIVQYKFVSLSDFFSCGNPVSLQVFLQNYNINNNELVQQQILCQAEIPLIIVSPDKVGDTQDSGQSCRRRPTEIFFGTLYLKN